MEEYNLVQNPVETQGHCDLSDPILSMRPTYCLIMGSSPTTSRWHNTRFSWCGVKAQLLLLKCHARHRGCHHDAVWPCTTESIIYRRDQKGIVGDDAVVACDLLNYLDSWYFVIVWQYICGNIAIVPTTSTLCRLLSERGYHGSAVF